MTRHELGMLLDVFESAQDKQIKKYIGLALRKTIANLTCDSFPTKLYHATKLTPQEVKIGQQQGKLACIREYRERTGLGLYDSKCHVEDAFSMCGLQFGPVPLTK